MSKSTRCPHCDAKMVEYKHGLSKGLARSLYLISKHLNRKNEFHIAKCEMTYSQRENSRKLKHWGIIEKLGDKDSKGGWWRLTDIGEAFIRGNIQLRKYVWSYRGDFVRFDGDRVYITQMTDGWKYRTDYVREAVPRGPEDLQQAMF